MKNIIISVLAFALVVASHIYCFARVTWFGLDFDQASFYSTIILFVIILFTIPVWFKEDYEKKDSFPFLMFICAMMCLLLSLVMYIKIFKGLNIPSGVDVMISGVAGFIATVVTFFAAALIYDGVKSINYPKV